MHEDARGGHAGPTWVTGRDMPRPIAVGDLGTIEDTIGGDLVIIPSLDGARVVVGLIGFKWHDGGAHVHLGPPFRWVVTHGSTRFSRLEPGRVVRFLGVRPWSQWHEADLKRRRS